MVFTNEEFLEVATKNWPKWNLNPQPSNSVQRLKPTELSGHYIYIYTLLYFTLLYCYLIL